MPPSRPEPELVSTTRDPVTGRTTTIYRCTVCGKEVKARGYGAHWRIMHEDGGGSALIPASSPRAKSPKSPQAPAPVDDLPEGSGPAAADTGWGGGW